MCERVCVCALIHQLEVIIGCLFCAFNKSMKHFLYASIYRIGTIKDLSFEVIGRCFRLANEAETLHFQPHQHSESPKS